MNNKQKIIIIIGMLVIIGASFAVGFLIGQKNAPKYDLAIAQRPSQTFYATNIKFVRTYNIVANLNKTDTIGENNFYVIELFQTSEPVVIKVNKKYVLKENENYEFTFKGNKIEGKDYTIQDIFNTFDIINIEKTDKTGLDQRQDAI